MPKTRTVCIVIAAIVLLSCGVYLISCASKPTASFTRATDSDGRTREYIKVHQPGKDENK